MKTTAILTIGVALFVSAGALAQTAAGTGDPTGPKPAVKINKDTNVAAPIDGKSSFTADQAVERMRKRGYNITSNPLKDDKGIWYAEGKKDNGQLVQVMVDYQGNVFESGEYTGHPSSAPGIEPTLKNPIAKAPSAKDAKASGSSQ